MKRRKALKSLGLGLSAGLVMPQFLAACKKNDPGPEVDYAGTVAVIGAGAAGLYAADILRSKGVKVIVLEASSQMGGRIKSLRNQINVASESIADFPVEMGAEITYGSDSIWGKIIQNLNVPTVKLGDATDQFILEQTVKSATDWGADPDFSSVQNFITNLPVQSWPAVSVEAAAAVSSRALPLLNSQVGNLYGASASLVGAAGLSEGMKLLKRNSDWIVSKANPLQDLLLSRFSQVTSQVQTGVQIKSINFGTDPISMTDQNGNPIAADKVIVTVPLSILKSGDIEFSPALPSSMTSSLSRIGMDASIRVVIDFKKNFWGGETIGNIWGGTDGPQYFSAGFGRSEFWRTMSITINGPKALELSGMGADMINPIIAELDALYDGQATVYVRRNLDTGAIISIAKDWTTDEFIKGGYSYPLPSTTIDDRKNIGAPINNKLFFAGEATDVSGDSGTINGALASAERVVEEVVKSITAV